MPIFRLWQNISFDELVFKEIVFVKIVFVKIVHSPALSLSIDSAYHDCLYNLF